MVGAGDGSMEYKPSSTLFSFVVPILGRACSIYHQVIIDLSLLQSAIASINIVLGHGYNAGHVLQVTQYLKG